MKYLLIFLLVLAIFVISVTLGAQNDQQVTFNYLLAQGEYRISTLLAVLFAVGFAACSGCGSAFPLPALNVKLNDWKTSFRQQPTLRSLPIRRL